VGKLTRRKTGWPIARPRWRRRRPAPSSRKRSAAPSSGHFVPRGRSSLHAAWEGRASHGAGATHRWLKEQVGAAELVDIRRQREPWMREVVRDFADGRVGGALDALSEHGRLHVARGRGALVRELVATWEEGHASRSGDAERAAAGGSGGAWPRTGDQVRVDEAELCVGDRVMFRRNDQFLGVRSSAS